MTDLNLSKEVYSTEKINSAITAYKTYADIQMTEEQPFWHLSFSGCKYDEELTVKEFENYLIGLENI